MKNKNLKVLFFLFLVIGIIFIGLSLFILDRKYKEIEGKVTIIPVQQYIAVGESENVNIQFFVIDAKKIIDQNVKCRIADRAGKWCSCQVKSVTNLNEDNKIFNIYQLVLSINDFEKKNDYVKVEICANEYTEIFDLQNVTIEEFKSNHIEAVEFKSTLYSYDGDYTIIAVNDFSEEIVLKEINYMLDGEKVKQKLNVHIMPNEETELNEHIETKNEYLILRPQIVYECNGKEYIGTVNYYIQFFENITEQEVIDILSNSN